MKKHFSFLSDNQQTTIHGIIWLPEKEPRAVLQLVHGMAEFIERYEPFAQYLNRLGWIVIGHDHLGHGNSVQHASDYGYFDKKRGSDILISDTYMVTKICKKKFKHLPYFVLGHSMGSFILRNYLKTYGHDIDGAVIMGTGAEKKELIPLMPILKQLNKLAPKKSNPTIDRLAFGNFSKYFPEKESGFNWLSKHQENVKTYEKHPKLGFIFTNNGFYTLFKLMTDATKENWTATIPITLPILVISGERDPVGEFGKGPRKVASQLQQHGMEDLTLHLYHELRHEILNEEENHLIMSDILEWMEMRL